MVTLKDYLSAIKFGKIIGWIIGVTAILVALIFTALVCFNFGLTKTQAFMIALFLAMLKKTFLNDIIWIGIRAMITSFSRKIPKEHFYHKKKAYDSKFSRIEVLAIRLNKLKRIYYFQPHDERDNFISRENEELRIHYQEILRDLIMFTFYMVTLLLIVLGTRDPLAYYSVDNLKFTVGSSSTFTSSATSRVYKDRRIVKCNNIFTKEELFSFIKDTLAKNLNDGRNYNMKKFDEPGWMSFEIAKILGVVRIRQKRTDTYEEGQFTIFNGETGWSKNYTDFPFKTAFWRIIEPWKYKSALNTSSVLKMGIKTYTGDGYVSTLGRTWTNTLNVIQFLDSNNWIDDQTMVVFIEFTLYNVDANLFSIINIMAERTPFKSFWATAHIDSVKLLVIIQDFSLPLLAAFFLYIIMIFVFIYSIVLMIRHSKLKEFYSKVWNCVDTVIVFMSMITLGMFFLRSHIIEELVVKLETTQNNEFVNYDYALLFDNYLSYLSGILVCIAIVRIWKILHFSSIFRVFTTTLKKSALPLLMTIICMGIFITAFGMAVNIINGNHSAIFSTEMKSITASMVYAFGFGKGKTFRFDTTDLYHGGEILGMISFVALLFVCAIFLVNLFIIVACHYFATVNQDQDIRKDYAFSFWRFLKDEYGIKYLVCKSRINKMKSHKNDDFTRLKGGEDTATTGEYSEPLRLRGGGNKQPKAIKKKTRKKKERKLLKPDKLNKLTEILECELELMDELLDDYNDEIIMPKRESVLTVSGKRSSLSREASGLEISTVKESIVAKSSHIKFQELAIQTSPYTETDTSSGPITQELAIQTSPFTETDTSSSPHTQELAVQTSPVAETETSSSPNTQELAIQTSSHSDSDEALERVNLSVQTSVVDKAHLPETTDASTIRQSTSYYSAYICKRKSSIAEEQNKNRDKDKSRPSTSNAVEAAPAKTSRRIVKRTKKRPVNEQSSTEFSSVGKDNDGAECVCRECPRKETKAKGGKKLEKEEPRDTIPKNLRWINKLGKFTREKFRSGLHLWKTILKLF